MNEPEHRLPYESNKVDFPCSLIKRNALMGHPSIILQLLGRPSGHQPHYHMLILDYLHSPKIIVATVACGTSVIGLGFTAWVTSINFIASASIKREIEETTYHISFLCMNLTAKPRISTAVSLEPLLPIKLENRVKTGVIVPGSCRN